MIKFRERRGKEKFCVKVVYLNINSISRPKFSGAKKKENIFTSLLPNFRDCETKS